MKCSDSCTYENYDEYNNLTIPYHSLMSDPPIRLILNFKAYLSSNNRVIRDNANECLPKAKFTLNSSDDNAIIILDVLNQKEGFDDASIVGFFEYENAYEFKSKDFKRASQVNVYLDLSICSIHVLTMKRISK